jgi:hypothetical protein
MGVRVAIAACILSLWGCTVPASSETQTPADSTPEVEAASPTETSVPMETRPSTLGQQLPISAKANLGGQDIFLEVARTPQQQAMGLMHRPALPDDRGMLFLMTPPRLVSFWMMNVPVPLDMVFIYQGKILAIAAEVPPCTATPCPTYGPGNQLVDAVIELRSGRAAELGLAPGDTVIVTPLEPTQ